MARTLRGFEEEFPYLGGRGDVSDASIVAKEEAYGAAYGAISEKVVSEMFGDDDEPFAGMAIRRGFGATAPAGFTFGPMGQLVRVTAPVPAPQGAQPAASALQRHAGRTFGVHPPAPTKPHWGSGDTWTATGAWGPSHQAHLDRIASQLAQKHGTNAFKVHPKKGGAPTYVFTNSPWATSKWAKLYGMRVQALQRAS